MSAGDKPELNPYESPREAKPLTREQVVKRAVGVGALLLLTPPAMIIAVLCCCTASWINMDWAGWIAFGGPFVVLMGLMATGIVLDRSRNNSPAKSGSRTALFIATPFVVAAATVAGFFLALFGYALANSGYPSVLMAVFFYLPPALALLFMLCLIWQAK